MLLRELHANGLSAAQICREIDNPSRNSVIGKLHRLGLSQPKRKAPLKTDVVRKRRNGGAVMKTIKSRMVDAIKAEKFASGLPAEPDIPFQDEDIPIAQRCSIMHLTSSTCRYPVGMPGTEEFFFCGGPTILGAPYCRTHCGVCFKPFTSRNRHIYIPRA
jgi:GcrA cell cycle regulator